MSDYKDETPELMAKEITIALIQKSGLQSKELLEYTCKAYDQVLKQIVKTIENPRE